LLLSLPLGLSGCYKTTRIVQQTTAPPVVRVASAADLVKRLNGNFDAIKSFNASVTIAASTGGGRTGKVTDYTAFKGYILMRKPSDLRVILQVPAFGSVAMDMVSDGKNFKLIVPIQNKARIGTDQVKYRSRNSLENLRPGIFFDSILIRSVGTDEFVALTDSDRPLPADPKTHIVPLEADYDLAILGHASDAGTSAKSNDDTSRANDDGTGNILITKRVVHYSRQTLLPYRQDIYDDAGRIVTIVNYSNYQPYGDIEFPTEIDITRPFDEYALRITITKLTPNQTLDDEQFHLEIPAGMTIQNMDLPPK
jgi:outer membrane lipoprotein-sorting protein